VKHILLAAFSIGLMVSPLSSQVLPRCLHGSDERADDRARREQALTLAQAINRAQNTGPALRPFERRSFRPLDQLTDLPPAPADFTVQLDTDGASYTFSIKDTIDPCRYAIFSDQDQAIYEAMAGPPRVYLRPADIP
jgi:hypothetical protein